MSEYQAFIDGFPGDNTLYYQRIVNYDASANTITFIGRCELAPADLPHTYRMILWHNNVYVWYNSIRVLTVTYAGDVENGLQEISFTFEIDGPLAL